MGENKMSKVDMDSCNVPGSTNFCKTILPEALDTCEGVRYSCYIGADMVMVRMKFSVNLNLKMISKI